MLGIILAVFLIAIIVGCIVVNEQARKKRKQTRAPMIVLAVAVLVFLIVPFNYLLIYNYTLNFSNNKVEFLRNKYNKKRPK